MESGNAIITLRKSILREMSRYYPPIDALRPHESMDLECRIDDVLHAGIEKAATEKAKEMLETELDVRLTAADEADAEVELAESAVEDAEMEAERARANANQIGRKIRKLEKAGKRK